MFLFIPSHIFFSKFNCNTSILDVQGFFCHCILIFAGHHVHAYIKKNQVIMFKSVTREESVSTINKCQGKLNKLFFFSNNPITHPNCYDYFSDQSAM
jgi:hypothetical protein